MFGTIRKWAEHWKLPKRSANSVPDESNGRELIFADPRRRDALVEIKNLQIGIPQEERSALVDPVLIRFAHFVVDLPASEGNHDAKAYGLLDHSLGVALAATRELVRPSFRPSEDPTVNHREQPIWAYAGFVLGLLHDVGKALDLEVVLSNGGPAWDPLIEPLSTFLDRYGRRSSGPETWRWKRGRGLNGHVEHTETLAPQVIPSCSKTFLGRRLEPLLSAFKRSYQTGKEVWRTGPAGRVVAAVRRADQAQSEAARPPKEGEKPQNGTTVASLPPEGAEIIAAKPESPAAGTVIPIAEGRGNTAPSAEPGGPARFDEGIVKQVSTPAFQSALAPHSNPEAKVHDAMKRASHLRQVSERDELIESEIKPEKILELIRSLLRSGTISRNGRRADLFVRQDHIWLRYPEVLRSILEGKNITWSNKLSERLDHVLRKMPQVVTENPKSALVYAFLAPRDKEPTAFVRLAAQGLLPEKELADLGYWPYEMRVQPTAIPSEKGFPFRAVPGGRA